MSEKLLRRLALGMAITAFVFTAAAAALLVVNRSTISAGNVVDLFDNHLGIYGLALFYSGLAALVLSRQPRNRIAWLMLLVGFTTGLTLVSSEYAVLALVVDPGLPAAVPVAVLQSVLFFPFVFPYGLALLLVLYPNGAPLSRRLWPVVWFATLDTVVVFGLNLLARQELTSNFRNVDLHLSNPLGVLSVSVSNQAGLTWLVQIGWLVVSAVVLVVRMLRATGAERQQLKWIVYVGVIMVAGFLVGILPLPLPRGTGNGDNAAFAVGVLGATIGIPVAVTVAVLRYRLYDIDVVISRTVVFAFMAAFIAAVYVAIVAGIGYVLGSGGRPNLVLSIIATAVVALAFQPVRDRAERLANQLVYGRQSTPYEVLSRFSDQVAVYGRADMLTEIAKAVTDGVGAAETSLWVREDNIDVARGSWPADHHPDTRRPGDRVIDVTHLGETVGAIAIRKPHGEPLTPVEEDLVKDIAAQAGPVIHNVSLNRELAKRVRELSDKELELRESRQRIVATQDAERRRLERNIHDGAQQHLVALAVKLRLARTFAARDRDRAAKLLEELEEEATEAQATLAALSRGVNPPILTEGGLEAALRQQASTLGLDCTFATRGIGRYDLEVEGAVYFCCLEALQNAAKHAGGARAEVALEESGAELQFSVRDRGPGFDEQKVRAGSGLRNMRDRIEALGGYVQVFSRPGQGAWIVGRVPVRAMEVTTR